MDDELTTFLASHGAVAVDPAWLQGLVEDMSSTVVPAIVAEIQERENLAAELRYAPVRRAIQAD